MIKHPAKPGALHCTTGREAVSQSVITSLEKQQNNPQRYNIYIDGEYAFSVHEDILVSCQLLKNRHVDAAEIKNILHEEEKNRGKLQALKYLGYRPRTRRELEQYLARKGFAQQIVRQTVEWCIEKKYIDDENYARQWVKERMANRPRGRHMLMWELQQRGIDPHVAEEALSIVGRDDELEAALFLLGKKFKPGSFADFATFYRKAGSYLQRKGFDQAIALRALEITKNEYLASNRMEEW